jgi:hypothetical protein
MNNFREVQPIKRIEVKVVSKYSQYKKELREDFNNRCGYCNDSDHWTGGWRFFQIDHFIPRKYLTEISPNEYSNLVYTCFFCNNSKRAKWLSKNEGIQFVNGLGFINPKEIEYSDHIYRDIDGNILALTPIGSYLVKELKLYLKRHSVIWKLEKLEMIFDEMSVQFEKAKDSISSDLKTKIIELFFAKNEYSKLLKKVGDE